MGSLAWNVIFTLSLRPSPLSGLALVLVAVGAFAMMRDSPARVSGVERCQPEDASCTVTDAPSYSATSPASIPAADFCVNVGYLCAGLEISPSIRLQRWRDFEGTVVVHVPLPENVDPALARDLQRAAAQGLRAWNEQPFPILADLRGDRDPHFSVTWRSSNGGTQLGVARTQWSSESGLRVLEIELAYRVPGRSSSQSSDSRQIRLTAAHEMGHALGLNHSDSSRDVMYPTNTATSMSAQDHRSMEVLYATPDGTVITR